MVCSWRDSVLLESLARHTSVPVDWMGLGRVIAVEGSNLWVTRRATAIESAKEHVTMTSPAEREMRETMVRLGSDNPDSMQKHEHTKHTTSTTTATTTTTTTTSTTTTTTTATTATTTTTTQGRVPFLCLRHLWRRPSAVDMMTVEVLWEPHSGEEGDDCALP